MKKNTILEYKSLYNVSQIKLHTCEKRRVHLRISLWHLMMNSKNNYLLKNCWSVPINHNSWWLPKLLMIWSTVLRYRVWQTEIGNYGSFFALLPYPPYPFPLPKNQKKIFYTCAPKTTIILGMATKIQSETERIFCPPNSPENQNSEKKKKESDDVIILHMCTKNHNHDVWFVRCKAPRAECFVILGHFLSFLGQPRKSKFWKN